MDFREEYKKSAEVMTPSAEAMERMTKNIMEQINAPAKKAIPFKKISYIGGAVAACAVITVGAVKLLPSMQTELATADAAANESVTAVYQDSAAEEEYAPLNGVTADKDSASDIITDFAMDAAEDAVAESESIFDYAADAGDDTTAVAAPTVGANEGSSLFEDKSIADNADIFVAEEGVMEEAEIAIDSVADENYQKHETTDSNINAEAAPEYSAEIIYVADDMQSFRIGDTEYIRLPDDAAIVFPDDCKVSHYMTDDGKEYSVGDFGDVVILTHTLSDHHGEMCGIYCTPDMYDYIANTQR